MPEPRNPHQGAGITEGERLQLLFSGLVEGMSPACMMGGLLQKGKSADSASDPQAQSDLAIFEVPKSLNIRKPERNPKISRLLQVVDGHGDLYKSDLYKNRPSYTNRTWPLVFV
jgi:hypothetical protein